MRLFWKHGAGAASQGANAQARPPSARQQEHKHLVAVGHGSDRFVSKGLVVSSTPSDGGVSLENQSMTSQLSQWKRLNGFVFRNPMAIMMRNEMWAIDAGFGMFAWIVLRLM